MCTHLLEGCQEYDQYLPYKVLFLHLNPTASLILKYLGTSDIYADQSFISDILANNKMKNKT